MTIINQEVFDQLLPSYSKTMGFVWLNLPGWPVKHCSGSAISILGPALTEPSFHYQSLIHPEDLAHVARIVSERMAGNGTNASETIEYRLRDRAGHWIWVESDTVMLMASQQQGEPITGFIRDISDRKAAESALQQNQDRLQLVLDGAQMGMWDWNPQTNEVICDDIWAKQVGLSRTDMSMNLSDWSGRVHPDDMDQCLEAIRAHLEGKTPTYENVHRMKHTEGHWVHILDRGKVFERDSDGNPTKFVGTHTDITQLKKVELDAVAALHARDRFFSAMSHELRTPLHAVLGMIELLEQDLTDGEHRKRVSLVRESSEHLLNMLKDILDVAKMDEGQLQLVSSEFDLKDTLNQVHQMFDARAGQKGLAFVVNVPQSIACGLKTDPVRITQIVVNLVSNAIKYTEQGHIELTLEEGENDLIISVRDTGIGIHDIETVLQPFQQEQRLREDDVHTTGLGLTIVDKLCKKLGIRLSIESLLGKGSKFSLHLPENLRSESVQESPIETKVVDPAAWPELSVLLVDDNQVNRVVARAMLQNLNVNVVEAADGEEALAISKVQSFDIICLDLHMPKLGGIRTTKAIRKRLMAQQPKIIGMSADAFPETVQKCLKAGMDEYLTKPFKRKDLIEVISSVL